MRLCDSPARKNGGRHCDGKPYEEKPCHQLPEASCINGKGKVMGKVDSVVPSGETYQQK